MKRGKIRVILLLVMMIFLQGNFCNAQEDPEVIAAKQQFKSGHFEAAITLFRQALNARPDCPEILCETGRSYLKLGEAIEASKPVNKKKAESCYQSAFSALEKSLTLEQNNAEAHANLARCYGHLAFMSGLFNGIDYIKKSKKNAEKALDLNPNLAAAWHLIGQWHRIVSKMPGVIKLSFGLNEASYNKAVNALLKAIEIEPMAASHHFELAKTYIAMELWDKARGQVIRSLECDILYPQDNALRKQGFVWLRQLNAKQHTVNKYDDDGCTYCHVSS